MKVEEALAIIDSAYQGDMFLPHTKGLGEAVKVVADALREAMSDLDLAATCDTCKHGPRKSSECIKNRDNTGCYKWRGPNPGGEGRK
jgi:hypothetical protein